MHVCVPRGGHSFGQGKHRPARQGWLMFVSFVFVQEVLGRADAACAGRRVRAYACASMWRAGCMCSVGTAGVRVARFRDGGHVELTWRRVDLRPARTRHGDWTGRRRNGVWPGRGVVQPTYESQGTAFGAQARRRETTQRTKGDAPGCACDRRGLARLLAGIETA